MYAYLKVISFLVLFLGVFCVEGSPQRRVDLATTPAELEIIGVAVTQKTGHALAVGDVNGDGISDLIIGAPGLDTNSQPQEGRIFVIFGSSALPVTLDLNTISADFEIEGRQAHSGVGTAVAAADINDDGFDDIIIGGPGTDGQAGEKAGAIFIVMGRASFPTTMNVLNADVRIGGEAALDGFGEAIAIGDLNNDGVSDVIFGVPFADPPSRPNGGKVTTIYGRSDWPSQLELSTFQPDLQVFGPRLNEFIGNAVIADDLNHDGRDDLIIGDFKANTAGGVDAGKTFVVFGSDTLAAVVDLASQMPDVTISGGNQQDHFGFAVSTGDFNGDGFSDLMVGARQANVGEASNAGKVYIFLSRETWPGDIDLTTDEADFTILGTSVTSNLGFSLTSGNINGDDMADMVIGAIFSSPEARTQSGEGFVFWGRPSNNGAIAFQADESDVDIWGAAPGYSLGSAVAIGDLNTDGRDDVIVSAEDAPPAGRVFVFSGDKITRVENKSANAVVPQAFRLHQNYPNPFNAGTTISLEVPANAGSFQVSIYDLQGQLVTHLFEGTARPGPMELRWDGRDIVGRSVGSGVYFYALNSGESFTIQRKLLLLK